MSSTLGKNLEISIFGESHGVAVGVTISGLPSGELIDMDFISGYLDRRSTGRDTTMSQRKEADKVIIVSGEYNGMTTGTPLTMMIYNTDHRRKDYDKVQTLARPSHADYTGYVRYKGYNDIRGGGHFSGRLTTPIVMAGALCLSILKTRGITIQCNILSIGKVFAESSFGKIANGEYKSLLNKDFPSLSHSVEMIQEINDARIAGDSVGGYIECAVDGVRVGIGSPMFGGVENIIAHAVFGVPAVKGIEFGESSELYGSKYNDQMYVDSYDKDSAVSQENGDIQIDDKVATVTNHDGGINGGITNGMPIIFTVKMKPTPSISKEQQTINYISMENQTIKVEGRHDPCVVVRAVPCIECVTAIAILDMLLEGDIYG